MVWGGMRGALSLALVLSLGWDFPYRNQLFIMTFGVVAFTIVVQGITIKPLIRFLGVGKSEENEYSRIRVQQIAIAFALSELEAMEAKQLISTPVYHQLSEDLKSRLGRTTTAVEAIARENSDNCRKNFSLRKRD